VGGAPRDIGHRGNGEGGEGSEDEYIVPEFLPPVRARRFKSCRWPAAAQSKARGILAPGRTLGPTP
jgi:hypothetical protein